MSSVWIEMNVDWDYLGKLSTTALEEGMVKGGMVLLGHIYNEAKDIIVFSGGRAYRAWDTGTLARSTGVSFSRHENSHYGPKYQADGTTTGSGGLPGASRGQAQLAFSTGCGYGRWVHDGTSRVPGRPFMWQAIGNHWDSFMSEVEREVKNAFRP